MLHKDRVFKEIAEMLHVPEATPDTPGWFKCRMKAIGHILERMTAEELEAVDAKKADMCQNGFPEEERPKCVLSDMYWPRPDQMAVEFRRAAKFANRRLDAAAKAHYLEMGLLSITLVTRTVLSTTGQHRLALEV